MSLELTLWINWRREAVCRNYRSITQLILWVLLRHIGLRSVLLKCLFFRARQVAVIVQVI